MGQHLGGEKKKKENRALLTMTSFCVQGRKKLSLARVDWPHAPSCVQMVWKLPTPNLRAASQGPALCPAHVEPMVGVALQFNALELS